MNAVSLIFPHQLFEKNPVLKKNRPVYLVEEPLFFTQYKFHKQKLVFHRSSMKAYQSFLEDNRYNVAYLEASERKADVRELLAHLKLKGVDEIHYVDTVDNWLEKRITQQAKSSQLKVVRYDSPSFLLSNQEVDAYFGGKKRLHQTDFYVRQRKHFKILVDQELKPLGGKWTFDSENRLKYPKNRKPPVTSFPAPNQYWNEAISYVTKNFANHYGAIHTAFVYPTTFAESRAWLNQFLHHRFAEFGAYEDAVVSHENVLHHSLLAPLVNVGLITPQEIIDEAISFSVSNNIPLNSCEGFVRQIIGWREFIRGVYRHNGTQERTTNYWKFTRKIPKSFWTGTTGIAPVDNTIKKVLNTGYCHHIERLMVLGNFMLLCEFDPDDVYQWFMELFIDSYDWVMVPNVYGMSQFADGGLMATKPYISGSNYLMKMSNYEKGDWQPIWDGLFWRFMHTHRDFFLQNPRLGMLVNTFDKMNREKKQAHLQHANQFLKALDAEK